MKRKVGKGHPQASNRDVRPIRRSDTKRRRAGGVPRVWFALGALAALALIVGGVVVATRGRGAAEQLWILRTRDIHALAFSPNDPNVAFFGHHDGIMRSNDGGQTWSRLVDRPNFDAMGLAVSHADSRRLLLAGHDILQVSNDGGASWRAVGHNLPGTDIHGFTMSLVDSNRPFAFVVGSGLFRSDDGGGTWQRITAQLPGDIMGLAAAGGNPETLYAASMQQGLLKSGDGGQTWGSVGSSLPKTVLAVAVDPTAPTTVYAGLQGGLYKSDDSGATWTKLPFPGNNAAAVAVSRAQPGRLMAVTAGGSQNNRYGVVYRSDDGGETWAGGR